MSTLTMIWIAVAVAVILVLALGYVMLQQRRQRLRRRFGPEYERTMNERDTRGEAEQELRARQKRVATLDIKPLTPESRRSYSEQWTRVQEQFVDAPAAAVHEADQMVTGAMAERGYPTEDFEQQLSDLSVEHGRTLDHYRQAHEISERATPGETSTETSTEDLRQAMVHYRVLFEELLGDSDEHRPESAAQARDDQPALQDDSRNDSRQR
jgi:hypothetical protein